MLNEIEIIYCSTRKEAKCFAKKKKVWHSNEVNISRKEMKITAGNLIFSLPNFFFKSYFLDFPGWLLTRQKERSVSTTIVSCKRRKKKRRKLIRFHHESKIFSFDQNRIETFKKRKKKLPEWKNFSAFETWRWDANCIFTVWTRLLIRLHFLLV